MSVSSRHPPSSLEEIIEPLTPHFDALDQFLAEQEKRFEKEVRELVRFCLQHTGKRLRPILVFFGGWTDGSVDPDLVKAAAIVELVHLATLVHDDILDDATMRHRVQTANVRYGADTAVLLGDALFAQALNLAADYPTTAVCREVSKATRQVCTGEILQTFRRGDADLSLEEYYRMIDLKTAELFRVSAGLGARLSGRSENEIQATAEAARRLGVAYQIYDDLADLLAEPEKAGKTLGTDLKTGKFTLPLLLVAERTTQQQWAQLLEEASGNNGRGGQMREIIRSERIVEDVADAFRKQIRLGASHLEELGDNPAVYHLDRLQGFLEKQFNRFLISVQS